MGSTPESREIRATIEFGEERMMMWQLLWTDGFPTVFILTTMPVTISCIGTFLTIKTRIRLLTTLIIHGTSFVNTRS